jgi:putative glycosyltransferase (TIGR04372 family)
MLVMLGKGDFTKAELESTRAVEYFEKVIAFDTFNFNAYKSLYSLFMIKMNYGEMNRVGTAYLKAKSELAEREGLSAVGFRVIPSLMFTTNYGFFSHLAIHTKAKILGLMPPHTSVVLIGEGEILSNTWLYQYWKRYVSFVRNPVAIRSIKKFSSPIEDDIDMFNVIGQRAIWGNEAVGIVNKLWEEKKQTPLVTLSDKEIDQGWRELEKVGIPQGSWFVCLHVRTEGFKKRSTEKSVDIWDAHRNADINSYKKAISSIVERGGWVFRMGDPYMTPIEGMERVVDYANSDIRNDFIDVFLTAMCRFAVVTNSGYQGFSEVFEIPMVLTNFVSMTARASSNRELFIYKILHSKKEDRYLSFEEGMKSPLGNAICTPNYRSLGVDWIDNTQDEINDVVVEMMNRLDGNEIYTIEDEELQKQFNTLHKKYSSWVGLGRIGKSFVQKYHNLLH